MSKLTILKSAYRLLLVLLIVHVNCLPLSARDPDSVITIQNNQLLNSALAKPDLEATIPVDNKYIKTSIQSPILALKFLYIVKNEKGVFLYIDGTSRIYSMYQYNDSLLYFRRNDNFIENINYNIGAYFFNHAGSLYNYGGYGFWKTNGLLRKYNEVSREWDIVPLNKEVQNLFDLHHAWKNTHSSKVYILYEKTLHEGITDKYENMRFNPYVSVLDLKNNQITTLGKLSSGLMEAIQMGRRLIHTPEGIIVLQSPYAFYLKPAENAYYTITDNTLPQALERSNRQGLYYCYDGKVYFTSADYSKFDSVYLSKMPLKREGKIWKPIIHWNIILPLASALFISGLAFAFFRMKKRKKKAKVNPSHVGTTLVPVPLLTETEASLLQMLINKTQAGGFASSNDINYIIGCKDKNVGLQKKMRSDMINGINAKFKAYSKMDEPLIHSQRTDADKRYFQYAIFPELLDRAQEFVEISRSLES